MRNLNLVGFSSFAFANISSSWTVKAQFTDLCVCKKWVFCIFPKKIRRLRLSGGVGERLLLVMSKRGSSGENPVPYRICSHISRQRYWMNISEIDEFISTAVQCSKKMHSKEMHSNLRTTKLVLVSNGHLNHPAVDAVYFLKTVLFAYIT